MGECPVCLEALTEKIVTTFPCTHCICLPCFGKMYTNHPRCPVCRYNIEHLVPGTIIEKTFPTFILNTIELQRVSILNSRVTRNRVYLHVVPDDPS